MRHLLCCVGMDVKAKNFPVIAVTNLEVKGVVRQKPDISSCLVL